MKFKREYGASTAFIDLLFNVLVGIMFLFILAILLINPVAKKADITKVAEYMVVLEWDKDLNCDMDLWVKDPKGNVVFWRNKDAGVMHLERDDLGQLTDRIVNEQGMVIGIPNHENKEYTTLRGAMPGEYVVNVHFYGCRGPYLDNPHPVEVTVELWQFNPRVQVVKRKVLIMNKIWEEQTAFRFTLNDDLKVQRYDEEYYNLLQKSPF